MAIFAPDISVSTRGKAASSVASAAYMSRADMTDERTGERYDYSRVHPHEELVRDLGVTIPEEAPERFRDREVLWNEVEAAERRADAQVCRKIMIPLPEELSAEQNVELARAIVADRVADGHVIDACVHANTDGSNPHLHIMEPLRPTDADGFRPKSENVYLVRDRAGDEAWLSARELKSEKEDGREWEKVYRYRDQDGTSRLTKHQAQERGLDPIKDRVRKQPVQETRYVTNWNDRDRAEVWRAQWAELMNQALERAGREERVDHRSYERQGIERVPQRHEGPKVRAVEREAEKSDREADREHAPVTDVRRDNVERMRLNAQAQRIREAIARAERMIAEIKGRVRDAAERAREGIERAREALLRSIRHPERSFAGMTREVQRQNREDHVLRAKGAAAWGREEDRMSARRAELERQRQEAKRDRNQSSRGGQPRGWQPPREERFGDQDRGPYLGHSR